MAHWIQNKLSQLFAIACIFAIVSSCKKENMGDCIKSKGKESLELRTISSVDSLFLGRRLNFTLVYDSLDYIEIIGGENLIPLIETRQTGKTLSIIDNNKCNWVRDLSVWPEVKIHLKSLNILATRGTNYIKSANTLQFPDLILDIWENNGSINLNINNDLIYVRQHTGSTDIAIKGETNQLLVYMAGISKGDYTALEVPFATVDQRSSADVKAKVGQELYVSIFNDGNVIIKGNPELKKLNKVGKGELFFK
jgi:hypothetical protein